MEPTRAEGEPRPAHNAPASGPSLGPWRVGRRLGKGGMGAVYEGTHAVTGERRAIKTLLATPGAQFFQEDLARFRREADLVTRLAHPHVVAVVATDLHHEPPYLVMELLEGGTLRDLLRQGPLSVPRALELAEKLCGAIAHAHELGALHRDLKPPNVLFDAAGEPKLADFGLGRELGVSVERLTQTGEVLGTPAYMAPEQTIDARHVDARTDVYGLGALLYCMLSGRPPFGRASLMELLGAVRHQQPETLRSLRSDVPLEVEAICQRAMAKDPSDRYPSAQALGQALRSARALATPRPTGDDATPARKPTRWALPLLGALVLAGAALATLGLLGGEPGDSPPASGRSPVEVTPPTVETPTLAPPSPRAPARTPWSLPPPGSKPLLYSLTLSPRHPAELGLERASLELLLSLQVEAFPSSQARIKATVLRVRAWADGPDGSRLRHDSIGARDPDGLILTQALNAYLGFDLDPRDGEVRWVEGPTLDALPASEAPVDWPTRTLAWLFDAEGFESCWGGLARLDRSDGSPDIGRVTYAHGRPEIALLADDSGRIVRLAQVDLRVLGPGDMLAGAPKIEDDDEDKRRWRQLGTVWLTNGLDDPQLVQPGWPLVEPKAPLAFPAPVELAVTTERSGLRAAPWGPLVRVEERGTLLGASGRFQSGFRLVCLRGGLAWIRPGRTQKSPSRAVVVADRHDQAYAYPTRERKRGQGLGILPRGFVTPVLDEQIGAGGKRLQVPYLNGTGWILERDTEPVR